MTVTSYRIHPVAFYEVLRIIGNARERSSETSAAIDILRRERDGFTQETARVEEACRQLADDARRTIRRKRSAFDRAEDDDRDGFDDLSDLGSDAGFLRVMLGSLSILSRVYKQILDVIDVTEPAPIVMSDDRRKHLHNIQHLLYGRGANTAIQIEMSVNGDAVQSFVGAIHASAELPGLVVEAARTIEGLLNAYYERLHKRHAIDGVPIYEDAVVTDVASSIETNVDHHGEVMDGTAIDKVSSYTMTRARVLIAACKTGALADALSAPGAFIVALRAWLTGLYKTAVAMRATNESLVTEVLRAVRIPPPKIITEIEFQRALTSLSDYDPTTILHRPPTKIVTAAERAVAEHNNETIKGIVERLRDRLRSVDDVVAYVLSRKAEHRKKTVEEATFYLARIAQGNQLLGVAPGGLEVYAAERPRVKIEEVSGGGYDRVREFLASVTRDAELESLFAATHPTRSGERAHALLIGPPGSGKTEIMRAIGGLTDSIGISVKGSDFQTCWLGEAMKNPGRLFSKAVELHHKTGKRVHVLIDEIDQVLMEPETEQRSSGTNLVYEFLQLLDGVVDYPGVTLWGATNHPERLSTRVMRRFQFVEIVGELTVKDRAELLRRFCEALPVESDIDTWEKAAALIDGAVGDAVRKVAESLWRERIGAFVRRDREAAEKIAKTLVNEKGETTHHGDMNREARRALAASLREHFSISEAELLEHVRAVALSPSVRQEIDHAVETYASARRYLDLMRAV